MQYSKSVSEQYLGENQQAATGPRSDGGRRGASPIFAREIVTEIARS